MLGNILGVVKNYKRLVETFRLMRRGELFELDNCMQAAVFQELVVVMIYSYDIQLYVSSTFPYSLYANSY